MLDFISYTQFASSTLSISIKDTLLAVREFLLHSVSALLCHNNVKKAMDAVFSADPVIQLMKDVIEEEKEHHILQSCELRHMEALLLHTTAHFQSQQEVVQETLKIWLQLLHNSLTQAISIFHRSQASSIQCFMCKPARLSKEIKEWKLLFNYLFQGLLRDFSKFVSDEQFFIAAPVIPPTDLVIQLIKDVIEEEENRQILQTDLRPLNNLLPDLTDILLDPRGPGREILKIWLQLLHNCLEEAKSILHRYNPQQRQRRLRDCLVWKVLFDYLFKGLQRDISMFVTANQILHRGPDSPPEPLSKDDAWMLFKRIAFKNSPVSEDIEEYARKIADECSHLAITRVAAAMFGKNSVDEWERCLSSIKMNEGPSHPPLVDKHHQQLRWCYDALPNSNVQNCFLYCAMYDRGYRVFYSRNTPINVEELVEAWIAEGLVKSKEGSHLMDMAIGRTYINLLIHRCFFQSVTDLGPSDEWQSITVDDVVRDVAIYIGGKDEKCVFQAGRKFRNFPETENEDCKRISVIENGIENLPTEFIRPKLVSLFLSHNPIKELPVGFLVSLTSLKVLDLSCDSYDGNITSIPSSIGHLKQLEFLNLSGHNYIRHLPKEIGQLSSLQFLKLSWCTGLRSLPSEIGGLTNLKSLDLSVCKSLEVIPDEISQLILLNKLRIDAVEGVSEANIWKMKDLRNLTTLRIKVAREARIRGGIMGYWLEMRHLRLIFSSNSPGRGCELPDDMQKMSKLQRLWMEWYDGLSLPNNTFKFQHLEYIKLDGCPHLKELSPLERLPNLKYLELASCDDLKELGIGNSGRASGFLMLEKLLLWYLKNLESIGGACNNGVWNERVLPRLRMMEIVDCPLLKRLPVGMDKLRDLRSISGESDWWETLIWEEESMKTHLQNLFTTDWGIRSMFDL